MVTSPIKPASLSIDITGSGKLSLTLKPGQVVSGKVIKATIDSLATLLIKNKSVEVKTELPFKKGAILLLKVENANPKTGELRLSVVERARVEPGNSSKDVLTALYKSSGAAKAVSAEINTFKAAVSSIESAITDKIPALKAINSFFMPMDRLHGEGGSGLKDALKTSGLFFESKLASGVLKNADLALSAQAKKDMITALVKELGNDFKGALLKLRATLREADTIEILKIGNVKPEELALKVDKLLKNIEFFQLQSKLNDTLELFVPFFWKSLRDGELIFSESYKGAAQNKSYSCTINLDLESSGRVSAIVLLMYDSVHLSFIAEKKEFIAIIEENIPALKAKFKELGLSLGSIRASREDNIDFKAPGHKVFEEGFNVKA